MSEMPERVWVTPKWHEGGGQSGLWTTTDKSKSDWADYYTRYLRADLHDKEVEKLKAERDQEHADYEDEHKCASGWQVYALELERTLSRVKRESVRVETLKVWLMKRAHKYAYAYGSPEAISLHVHCDLWNVLRYLTARLSRLSGREG